MPGLAQAAASRPATRLQRAARAGIVKFQQHKFPAVQVALLAQTAPLLRRLPDFTVAAVAVAVVRP
jgi:hypothetical protein